MDDDESRAREARARNSAAARAQRLGNRNRSLGGGGGGGQDAARGGRGRGGLGGRGRGSRLARGLNEAAQALLGMGAPEDDEYGVRNHPVLVFAFILDYNTIGLPHILSRVRTSCTARMPLFMCKPACVCMNGAVSPWLQR